MPSKSIRRRIPTQKPKRMTQASNRARIARYEVHMLYIRPPHPPQDLINVCLFAV